MHQSAAALPHYSAGIAHKNERANARLARREHPDSPVFDASTCAALEDLISKRVAAALSGQQQGENRQSGKDGAGSGPDPVTEPSVEVAAEATNTSQVTDTPAAAPNKGTQDAAARTNGNGERD